MYRHSERKNMERARWSVFLPLLVTALMLIAPSQLRAKPEATPALLEEGGELFKKECSVCHGLDGGGNGEAAFYLFPKPRNLTDGVFKVRSTPSGSPPADEDLFKTISRGMPGSAMPSFSFLSEEERWALVYQVKKIAGITEGPRRVIEVPSPPELEADDLSGGEELYHKMKCWECHGYEGRGDGPSAATLQDDWGYPTPPNNFTRGIYKGGGSGRDIYLRFTTGMDGTAMPSYEDFTTDEERWLLANYVKHRAGEKVAVQPSTGDIEVIRRSGEVPSDPTDRRWGDVTPVEVPVMLLWQRQQVTDMITVRAVHNGDDVAILLEWGDMEPAARFIRHQDYTDAAAIQFPLSSEAPLFTMGEEGNPVNIWHWRADFQMDLVAFRDMEDSYPDLAADDYPWAEGWYPESVRKPMQLRPAAAPAHDQTFITGWGANNVLSDPWRASAVQDLNAEGFGTLTAQPKEEQDVRGVGFWVAGKWKVLFKRSLKTASPNDVQLSPGRAVPAAFAIWDGNKKDRDGQKGVTTWYNFVFQE